jgi:hypothetical protein
MSHYNRKSSTITPASGNQVKRHLKYLFANTSKKVEDELYPVTVSNIGDAKWRHRVYRFSNKDVKGKDPPISLKVVSETKLLAYKDTCLVISTEKMQSKIVLWYHHYLQHLDNKRLEETIVAIMFLRGIRPHMRKDAKTCELYQLGKR